MVSSYVNNLTTYTFDTAHNGIRHPVVIINLINLFHLPIRAAALAAVYDDVMDELGNSL